MSDPASSPCARESGQGEVLERGPRIRSGVDEPPASGLDGGPLFAGHLVEGPQVRVVHDRADAHPVEGPGRERYCQFRVVIDRRGGSPCLVGSCAEDGGQQIALRAASSPAQYPEGTVEIPLYLVPVPCWPVGSQYL